MLYILYIYKLKSIAWQGPYITLNNSEGDGIEITMWVNNSSRGSRTMSMGAQRLLNNLLLRMFFLLLWKCITFWHSVQPYHQMVSRLNAKTSIPVTVLFRISFKMCWPAFGQGMIRIFRIKMLLKRLKNGLGSSSDDMQTRSPSSCEHWPAPME